MLEIHMLDVRSCYKCSKISKLSCVSCPRALCKCCSERVKFRRLKGTLILCSVCLWLDLLIKEKKDADIHMHLAGINGEPWKITCRKNLQKEEEKSHGCETLPEKEMKFASIDPKNIDVVYLRKSLVKKLMQEPIESYNRKLTGSFVKIRLVQQSSYMLVQVIGVRWTQNGCCKLLWDESGKEEVVGISLLTDHDVSDSEDDCKELKLRIQRGLRKWPTVAREELARERLQYLEAMAIYCEANAMIEDYHQSLSVGLKNCPQVYETLEHRLTVAEAAQRLGLILISKDSEIHEEKIGTGAAANNIFSSNVVNIGEPEVNGVPNRFLGITPTYLWQNQTYLRQASLSNDIAEYQMPLLHEIETRLKAKCDKLADAFINDIDSSAGSSSAKLPERVKIIIEEIEREEATLREDL